MVDTTHIPTPEQHAAFDHALRDAYFGIESLVRDAMNASVVACEMFQDSILQEAKKDADGDYDISVSKRIFDAFEYAVFHARDTAEDAFELYHKQFDAARVAAGYRDEDEAA